MKKVIYLFAFVAIAFTGCNPLEDINDEVDAIPDEPNVGSFEYTLTDEDYANFDLSFGNFNSEEQAKDSIPQLLSDLYPLYGQGSSVLVNYKLYVGAAEGVSDYTDATVYELSNSDYATTGSDAFGFYPDVDATDEIPDVLDTQIDSPTEGQVVLAKYDQYTETPTVGLADLVAYDFAGSFQGWNIVEESGDDEVWTTETGNIRGNGFFGDQFSNVEWLVSPTIDLTGESNLKFQITQELDFAGDASLVKILVSTDYSGDVQTATWNEIILANPATGDMASSEDYDFSAYDGQVINMAFKYTSIGDDPSTTDIDEGDAARWRIASMAIKTQGATGDTDSKGEYFMYSGGFWDAVDDVYYLSSADYDSMGEEFGQPGRFDNFSSSTPADNYIPQFLNIKYPFAQEEDEIFIIYNYFSSSSGLGTRGNFYMFINGSWMAHQTVIETSLQFGYDNGVWVPDNTIRYTLSGADLDYIEANYATVDGYANAVASMAQYSNFDRRSSNDAYWSDTMILTVLNDLLDNVIAPGAENEQKYVISFDIYDGSNGVEEFSLIKIDGSWIINEE